MRDPRLSKARTAMHVAYCELVLTTYDADARDVVRAADALEDSIEELVEVARAVLSGVTSPARAPPPDRRALESARVEPGRGRRGAEVAPSVTLGECRA